jgi:hypothetical protein
MKKILLLSALLTGQLTQAQNLPACDTLLIHCCTFDSVGPNTLTLYADNHSSELFDYPGFVLFDSNMDTIAKETVAYFGIGSGFQPHTLDIVAPLNLPFSGTLNLYILFYAEQACSFPIYIADTAAAGIPSPAANHALKVFPNPALNSTTVDLQNLPVQGALSISVYDIFGKEIRKFPFDHSPMELSLKNFPGGMYVLRITDTDHAVIASHELVVGEEQ